jgi:pimeloyl-ACP methyl ester carboxylesterase
MVGTSWGQTHVRISGPEEAPPLVLLHGGGTNSLQWMYNIEGLSKEHRTFAVDGILDTGLSVNTRRIERAEELVEWLEETLDGLGLDTGVDILGLSYGGWIAARFALVHPDRLNKLVLIAPAATVAPLSLTWIKKAVLTLIPHRHFTANFLHWLLPGFARNDPVEFNAVVDEAFLAIRCFKLADMVNPDVLTETEWEKITIPVLFLIGEKEKIHSLPARKVVERLNRIAPRVTKQVIPGAGHDLTVVRTELVNGVVLKFLRQ